MRPLRIHLSRAVLAALVGWGCLLPHQAPAADWRQFRGPQGAAVEEDLELPAVLDIQRQVAWKAPLPGRGVSSPIVVGDRVIVTCSSSAQPERLHVVCLRATDGSKLWERRFWATGRTTCHEKICVATPTPASDGTRVFAVFSSNDLVCLDLDGNLLWVRGLMLDYPNASNSLGLSSSPIVSGGVLVVQTETDSDAFVVGIDPASGLNRWKIDRPRKADWTSPLLCDDGSGGQHVLLQSASGLTAIDPATGGTAWTWAAPTATVASAAVRGQTVFLPSAGITALQSGAKGESPRELWRSNQLRAWTPSPLLLGAGIFVVNDAGVLTRGDLETGARTWQLRLKGPFTASPVADARRLYLVNEKGLLQIVDPAKPEGEVVGEMDLGETILATPSIASGALYLRSDAHLWKITR